MTQSTTLVLGGGGVWGVAWMTGLIAGLAEAGVDVRKVDCAIGTSAGSVVAALICGPDSLEDLYARQIDPQRQSAERNPSPEQMQPLMRLFQVRWESREERVRAVCDLALNASTISYAERRADNVSRLGSATLAWPSKQLKITAVDADTGEQRVFDATSGVDLIDAIAASCAVPGVWPVVPVQGHRYVDGGVWRTAENAHLAAGAKSALIVSPLARMMAGAGQVSPLDQEIAELRGSGSKVTLVSADPDSLKVAALGPLNPATRTPAANAGRAQGLRIAHEVREAF